MALKTPRTRRMIGVRKTIRKKRGVVDEITFFLHKHNVSISFTRIGHAGTKKAFILKRTFLEKTSLRDALSWAESGELHHWKDGKMSEEDAKLMAYEIFERYLLFLEGK